MKILYLFVFFVLNGCVHIIRDGHYMNTKESMQGSYYTETKNSNQKRSVLILEQDTFTFHHRDRNCRDSIKGNWEFQEKKIILQVSNKEYVEMEMTQRGLKPRLKFHNGCFYEKREFLLK